MNGAAVIQRMRPRGMTRDELEYVFKKRGERVPWDAIANQLRRPVQTIKDAVWELECIGFQVTCEELAGRAGAERVAMFLRQCADALEERH